MVICLGGTMTDFYRAIADPIRRQILKLIAEREFTQSEIVQCFTISQPAMNKHLQLLKQAQLIAERREGKYRYYRLKREVFEASYVLLEQEIGNVLKQRLVQLKLYTEENDGR